MERVISKSFLDSDIYIDPRRALNEVIERLNLGEGVKNYIDQVLCSDNYQR